MCSLLVISIFTVLDIRPQTAANFSLFFVSLSTNFPSLLPLVLDKCLFHYYFCDFNYFWPKFIWVELWLCPFVFLEILESCGFLTSDSIWMFTSHTKCDHLWTIQIRQYKNPSGTAQGNNWSLHFEVLLYPTAIVFGSM